MLLRDDNRVDKLYTTVPWGVNDANVCVVRRQLAGTRTPKLNVPDDKGRIKNGELSINDVLFLDNGVLTWAIGASIAGAPEARGGICGEKKREAGADGVTNFGQYISCDRARVCPNEAEAIRPGGKTGGGRIPPDLGRGHKRIDRRTVKTQACDALVVMDGGDDLWLMVGIVIGAGNGRVERPGCNGRRRTPGPEEVRRVTRLALGGGESFFFTLIGSAFGARWTEMAGYAVLYTDKPP